MQNQTGKTNKKKKKLVFKPYLRGRWCGAAALKKGLRLLLYFFLFAFLYIIVGSAMQFDQPVLRVVLNSSMVLICTAILYMDGARLGESEVAFGEIAYARREAGKTIDEKDLDKCYHPLKGVFIALVAALPVMLLLLPHAVTAQKQVYSLQTLPSWVSSYASQKEIISPLSYYQQEVRLGVLDVLRMVARVLIFPFANMATVDNASALLVMDRLSPLLACLPMFGFPLGYLTGPKARAMVHGDISSSKRREQRRRKKAARAREARSAKKNELI